MHRKTKVKRTKINPKTHRNLNPKTHQEGREEDEGDKVGDGDVEATVKPLGPMVALTLLSCHA